MNLERFEQVKEMIRDEAESFDMGDWWRTYNDGNGTDTHCGTAACIAGFTCIAVAQDEWKKRGMKPKKPENWLRELIQWGKENIGYAPDHKAMEELGLTPRQAEKLFYPCSWPAQFALAYEKAARGCAKTNGKPDRRRMAEIACERIDYLIKEGK